MFGHRAGDGVLTIPVAMPVVRRRHDGDLQPELAGDAVRQVAAQPLRDVHGERRDDDLVEGVGRVELSDGLDRIGRADGAVDMRAGGAVEERQGELERGLSLIGAVFTGWARRRV